MNYGLYLSAAGAMTSMHRQDVYANNLANVNTIGFKPDQVFTRERVPARLDAGSAYADPKWMLEQLGGGQFVDPTFTNLTQGALEKTGNQLDVAIEGDGFLVVSSRPEPGPSDLRLTRDGRMTLNREGELVMSTTGLRVLDVNHEPIQLDPGASVRIDANGEISQDGQVVAQINFAQAGDPTTLRKAGDNLLRFRDDSAAGLIPAEGRIVQGHIESSAVDPIMAMNAMIGASKSVGSNATMMQYHDNIMGQAVNTFGRVG